MAQTATVFSFEVELAHVDRGVYDSLAFRVAQHPSETEEALLTRVLAYCLEYTDGIQFSSQGLSEPDEPPVSIRDATGALRVWIDIGVPDAARLHKASKAADRVVVYTHKILRASSASSKVSECTAARRWRSMRSIGTSSPRGSNGLTAG